jgi:hypothetical protein
MRPPARIIFTAFLLALVLLGLVLSLEMGSMAGMVPLWVSLLTSLLLLVQLMRDIRHAWLRSPGPEAKHRLGDGFGLQIPPARQAGDGQVIKGQGRELQALAWIGLFLLLLGLLGFQLAAPLCVLAFFKYRAGCTWPRSLALALATWVAIQLIFVWLLDMPLPRPLWRL